MHVLLRLSVTLLTCATLSGCATTGASSEDNDPLEPLNREIFAFNNALDSAVIKPAAEGYRAVLPQYVRDRIRSVIDNLNEPLIFANNVLQLRFDAAVTTLGRFMANSTAGLGGMFDRATADGMPRQSGDFGQTLYRWGVGSGPYLVLPVLGPSNVRDAIGFGVDSYVSPVGFIGSEGNQRIFATTKAVVGGLDTRERNIESVELLKENAIDFYAQIRNIVQQRRRAVLNEARETDPSKDLIDPAPPPR
ncbi:MAG: MlaA family lipoprotein [Burkholderiaceae bacterium]